MTYSLLYITAGSREEAVAVARELVAARLVACANVIPGATSLYWWEGAVQEETEAVLVAKTRSEMVEEVIERVRQVHSYTCPCVVALPIAAGNPPFLDWIGAETAAR